MIFVPIDGFAPRQTEARLC